MGGFSGSGVVGSSSGAGVVASGGGYTGGVVTDGVWAGTEGSKTNSEVKELLNLFKKYKKEKADQCLIKDHARSIAATRDQIAFAGFRKPEENKPNGSEQQIDNSENGGPRHVYFKVPRGPIEMTIPGPDKEGPTLHLTAELETEHFNNRLFLEFIFRTYIKPALDDLFKDPSFSLSSEDPVANTYKFEAVSYQGNKFNFTVETTALSPESEKSILEVIENVNDLIRKDVEDSLREAEKKLATDQMGADKSQGSSLSGLAMVLDLFPMMLAVREAFRGVRNFFTGR